jgi:hypothetical protein
VPERTTNHPLAKPVVGPVQVNFAWKRIVMVPAGLSKVFTPWIVLAAIKNDSDAVPLSVNRPLISKLPAAEFSPVIHSSALISSGSGVVAWAGAGSTSSIHTSMSAIKTEAFVFIFSLLFYLFELRLVDFFAFITMIAKAAFIKRLMMRFIEEISGKVKGVTPEIKCQA